MYWSWTIVQSKAFPWVYRLFYGQANVLRCCKLYNCMQIFMQMCKIANCTLTKNNTKLFCCKPLSSDNIYIMKYSLSSQFIDPCLAILNWIKVGCGYYWNYLHRHLSYKLLCKKNFSPIPHAIRLKVQAYTFKAIGNGICINETYFYIFLSYF